MTDHLFDLPAANGRPVDPARTDPPLARQTLAAPPRWSAYYGRHVVCGEGQRLTHEKAPAAHLTAALYRRGYRGETTLLCTPCAQSWRAADGMIGLPKRRGDR